MSAASQAHGQRKTRQPEPEADPEFQIAPMIDILLVLLVFFMSISSTEVLQSNRDIKLPIAKEAQDAKKNPGQVIVNILYSDINNSTIIEVNEVDVDAAGLIPMLQKQVETNPLVRVLIRADRSVRYENLRSILQSVGSSGVSNVTFSVVDKDEGT
ncbi:MAG: ExbD/TolR family protein [Chthoniobacterales bacterium]